MASSKKQAQSLFAGMQAVRSKDKSQSDSGLTAVEQMPIEEEKTVKAEAKVVETLEENTAEEIKTNTEVRRSEKAGETSKAKESAKADKAAASTEPAGAEESAKTGEIINRNKADEEFNKAEAIPEGKNKNNSSESGNETSESHIQASRSLDNFGTISTGYVGITAEQARLKPDASELSPRTFYIREDQYEALCIQTALRKKEKDYSACIRQALDIFLELDAKEYASIRNLALSENKSMGTVIREAIRNYMN